VGTWSQIAAGRVLVGEGGGYTAGATAGSKDAVVVSHSHTTSETAHSHTIGSNEENSALGSTNSVNTRSVITNDTTNTTSTGLTVDSEGVSGTDANMMPYLVVYIWERTA
jgi:microcystin-dependent protein